MKPTFHLLGEDCRQLANRREEETLKRGKLLLWSILCIIFLVNGSVVFGDVVFPSPTRAFYVGDFAGILSDEVENFVIHTNRNYEKTEEKPQVVVVTVPSLQGLDVESYAVRLFEQWKIGNQKYDNGVLLLLALEDRKVRIEVGYGLEGAIPDGLAGEILDTVKGDLSDGNYSEGLKYAFYLISQAVNREYNFEDRGIFGEGYDPNMEKPLQSYDDEGGVTLPPIFKIAGILLILLLLWMDYYFLGGFFTGLLLRGFFHGGRGGRGGGGGFGGGSSGGGGRSGGGGSSRGF
ncbi:TPM domain-containing protein [Thermotalea metallivorans]|uniref:TPM domain-containing protein n=1 Tax=Thermotalea metallivorans TaxID=520762 RepID=A0A140L151_9FIRM|nr:TPM domain-containing protein [Thermotalea metallivorans]KXG74276.1 hypothetical protein AN619_24680 [Thermotalea metallivorans]